MKTKAYKIKENIARYMYEYIGRNNVSICFDNDTGIYERWEIHVDVKKGKQHGWDFINHKREELENILGFEIVMSFCMYRTTLLWNKKKEDKYLKIRKEQELRHQKLHDTFTELDYFSFPLELIGKAIRTTLLKDKK